MLSLQTFTTLVQNMAASVQGACSTLLDLTVGSVLRAILEANASIALWLQWLLVLLMNRQRLVTCSGTDVDTFVNDFAMYRLAAVAATGNVTFARFTSTASATIPVGTIVMTGDGSQQFAVVAVATNSYWNGAANGYIIPAGTASAALPIQAVTAGSAGNVLANTISLLGSAIAGVDTVNNAAGMTGGADAESDVAVKARFPNYIGSLSKATPVAVAYAVQSVQQGLTWNVAENAAANGSYQPGNFVVTVDDGSGDPSSTLLSEVYAAVDAVRPIGSTFAVQGPSEVTAAVVLTLTVAAGVVKNNVIGTVAEAISAYVNALPVGANLYYAKLAQVIFDSLPSGQIVSISPYTINSGTADITATATQVIKASPPPVVN